MKIPFIRGPAPDAEAEGELARGDITLRECKKFSDAAGKEYTADEWKKHNISRALALKDEVLISDPQYHATRSFILDILRGQDFCQTAPKHYNIPSLTSVKKLRLLLDNNTKATLKLKGVMGAASVSSTAVICDDCSRLATCYCAHKKCEDAKNMCQEHLAIHSERKTTKGHVVYSIDTPPRYSRPLNMIGAGFDLKSMINHGLTLFWEPELRLRVQRDLPIFLRFTLDGAMLTLSKSFCTASIKWMIEDLDPDVAEWLIRTVHCQETTEMVDLHFRPLLKEVDEINASGFPFTPPGPGTQKPVVLKIRILIGPDGKMLNVVYGARSHMCDMFCVQCKIDSKSLADDPWTMWEKGDPQVSLNRIPGTRYSNPAVSKVL